jgi:Ca-activated chloride channel family protein
MRRLAGAGSIALLLCLGWRCEAQLAPPDEFFHSGAQFYLSNNLPKAWEQVTNGRAIYPDDIKLKKLEELLKQQQQQQQQQKQQQNDQSKPDEQQNQQQDRKDSDEKKQQEQQKKDSQEKQDQQKENPADQQKQKPDEEQQSYPPGQMTPQQARQLLDAQKNDETLLPVKPDQKTAARRGPLRDW